MSMTKHGLSVGLERVQDEFLVVITAVGKLTHADYEFITPVLDSALREIDAEDVKVLVDITELRGWELRAAWDDFKLGLKHGSHFSRIAIYGDKEWQELAAKVGGWFIAGEVHAFTDYQEAWDWVTD